MTHFARGGKVGLLLQAEVPQSAQARFERRYRAATRVAVTPGNPKHYQNQPNKRAAELRVYFNDPGTAIALAAAGFHVEYPRRGYLAGKYRYRVNNNRLWWALVEDQGLQLGAN